MNCTLTWRRKERKPATPEGLHTFMGTEHTVLILIGLLRHYGLSKKGTG